MTTEACRGSHVARWALGAFLWAGVVATAYGEDDLEVSEVKVSRDRELTWNVEVFDRVSTYHRMSSGLTARYSQMRIGVRAHDLRGNAYGDAKSSGLNEVLVGGEYDFGPAFHLDLEGGYFSAGTGEFEGDLQTRYSTEKWGQFFLGGSRLPLALRVPLAKSDQGVMQNVAVFGYQFDRLLEMNYEFRKEENFAAHDFFAAVIRVPLLRRVENDHAGDLRVVGSNSFHSRPSPFYGSPLRVTTGAIGYEWRGRVLRDVSKGTFAGDYGIARVAARDRRSIEQVGFYSLTGALTHEVNKNFHVAGKASYLSADQDINESLGRRLINLMVDLDWTI